MAHEHPEFKRKAHKTAQNTAKSVAGKVVAAVKRMARAAANLVKSNPKVVMVVIICALLLFIVVQSCSALTTLLSNTIGGAVGASTFPSEDVDMLAAERAYAGMEAELQYELDNYQSLHPDYDEYIFYLDEIKHDPYVLISFVTVWHEGPWVIATVEGTLLMLFERQYILTESVEVEIRYRTESVTYTDPDTGASVTEDVEVPYEYFICVVTLENVGLENVATATLSGDSLAWYMLYMATLGNRPDLFPIEDYPQPISKTQRRYL